MSGTKENNVKEVHVKEKTEDYAEKVEEAVKDLGFDEIILSEQPENEFTELLGYIFFGYCSMKKYYPGVRIYKKENDLFFGYPDNDDDKFDTRMELETVYRAGRKGYSNSLKIFYGTDVSVLRDDDKSQTALIKQLFNFVVNNVKISTQNKQPEGQQENL